MKLAYTAIDVEGRLKRDTIEAESPTEATEALRRRDVFVTSIEAADGAADDGGPHRRGSPGRRLRNVALWSRQLSVLVQSGTQLAPALAAIERQVRPGPWRDTLGELRLRVEEGESLSIAMGDCPNTFDDIARSLVAAGESSGQLGLMLGRVAAMTRRQLKVRNALLGAMVYPALLVMIGLAVTIVMLVLVIPRFVGLFESLELPVPATTQLLIGLSELVRGRWWLLLIALVAGSAGIKFASASRKGRALADVVSVRTPAVGKVARNFATARIVRLLGVMLESHVPMLEALRLTRSSAGNSLYEALVAEAEEAATQGRDISHVFGRSPLVSASVAEAIHHGEANGKLGTILTDMAEFLDEENELVVRSAMSIVEPLILVTLGVAVGLVAISLFLPLFDLASMAGAR